MQFLTKRIYKESIYTGKYCWDNNHEPRIKGISTPGGRTKVLYFFTLLTEININNAFDLWIQVSQLELQFFLWELWIPDTRNGVMTHQCFFSTPMVHRINYFLLGMVEQACNPNTWETEWRMENLRPAWATQQVWDQPGLHSKTVSKSKTKAHTHIKNKLGLFVCLNFFGSKWIWTQGFTLAGKVLCYLSHTSSPFFPFKIESHTFYTGKPRLLWPPT
jgi:hypothetical protein